MIFIETFREQCTQTVTTEWIALEPSVVTSLGGFTGAFVMQSLSRRTCIILVKVFI